MTPFAELGARGKTGSTSGDEHTHELPWGQLSRERDPPPQEWSETVSKWTVAAAQESSGTGGRGKGPRKNAGGQRHLGIIREAPIESPGQAQCLSSRQPVQGLRDLRHCLPRAPRAPTLSSPSLPAPGLSVRHHLGETSASLREGTERKISVRVSGRTRPGKGRPGSWLT